MKRTRTCSFASSSTKPVYPSFYGRPSGLVAVPPSSPAAASSGSIPTVITLRPEPDGDGMDVVVCPKCGLQFDIEDLSSDEEEDEMEVPAPPPVLVRTDSFACSPAAGAAAVPFSSD